MARPRYLYLLKKTPVEQSVFFDSEIDWMMENEQELDGALIAVFRNMYDLKEYDDGFTSLDGTGLNSQVFRVKICNKGKENG